MIPKSHYRQVRGHCLCIAGLVLPYLRHDLTSRSWIERIDSETWQWQRVEDQESVVRELLEAWISRGVTGAAYAEILLHPDVIADAANHLKAKLSPPHFTAQPKGGPDAR
ncbi:MAG: hypothetical protein H0U66_06630 [Gemmatimonadaceae bacterium]|nr:hypothetical protein [Gemmatimonadaceae bacterium]